MPAATQPTPAASRRRSGAAKTTAMPAAPKAKKLSPAAVEATAAAFMAGFSALPGAVQWRVVQLIEAREDEADAREVEAIKAARAADFDPAELPTIEEYLAQRRASRSRPAAKAQSAEQPQQLAA